MRTNELYISFKDLNRHSQQVFWRCWLPPFEVTALYLPKGRSFPKLQELVPINALSSAFSPSSSLEAGLAQLQNLSSERAGYPVRIFSSHDIFMTVNWFLPHLPGKMIRSASSASKEAAASTEMQKNSPSYPRAGDNFLLLSDMGLFSSFLIGCKSFPFYQPGPCLNLYGDPSWQW